MQETIRRELAILGGRSACIVMRLEDAGPQELVSINPAIVFPAASLIKVPLLVEVTRQVELGMLNWQMRYSVTEAARVPSDGVVGDLSPEIRFSLRDLAHLMIAISDNTASNMLLDLVGMEAVNTTMQKLGLNETRFERRFIDFEARKAGRDNWTSAGDMALLFSYFCTNRLPGREAMLRMLVRQNDYTILPAYWGEFVPFAHKTGGLAGIIHDAGILYPPLVGDATSKEHTPIIIVAMTAEQQDEPQTRHTLARIGRIIYSQV